MPRKRQRWSAFDREPFHISKFCGPGTKARGKAYGKLDKACKKHDAAYSRMLKKGQNPYNEFNLADALFLRAINHVKGAGALAARAFFKSKRRLAPSNKITWKKRKLNTSSKPNFNDYTPLESNEIKHESGAKTESLSNMAYGRKKRTYKKRKSKRSKSKRKYKRRSGVSSAKLEMRVKALAKRLSSHKQSAVQEFRSIDHAQWSSNQNEKGYNWRGCLTREQLIARIDQTNPMIEDNGLKWRDMQLSNQRMKIVGGFISHRVRNNYTVPVTVDYYTFKCADNSSTNASVSITALLAEYAVATPPTVFVNPQKSLLYSVGDVNSKIGKNGLWRKCGKRIRRTLQPSDEFVFFTPLAPLKLGINLDSLKIISGSYIKGLTIGFVIQTWGIPIHGGTGEETEIGICETKVDVTETCHIKYRFVGDQGVRKAEGSVDLDTITAFEAIVGGGDETVVDIDQVMG